jgi:cell shape-determining protein MreD
MTAAWSGLAIVLALLLQSGLSLLLPGGARLIDPLLLITIFVCLTRGENTGMLVATAAAWAQDLQFGVAPLGLLGLARVLVAFAVGQAGRRFLITSLPAQLATVFAAALVDVWLLARFAAMFEVSVVSLPITTVLARAALNAVVGAVAFQLIERRLRREPAL